MALRVLREVIVVAAGLLVLAAGVAQAAPPVVTQITFPASNATGRFRYEGFIADNLCVDRRTALDGADMWRQPQRHSLHCLVEIPACLDSGFCLMQQHSNGLDWGCAYTFSQPETLTIRDRLMVAPMTRTNLYVHFDATWDSASRRMVVNFTSMDFATAPFVSESHSTGIVSLLAAAFAVAVTMAAL